MAASSQAPVSGSSPETGASGLDLCILGQGKSILHVDPKIAHRVLDFAMAEQDLNRTKVFGRPVDYRCFRSAKRVRAIFALQETDTCYPFVDKPAYWRVLRCQL